MKRYWILVVGALVVAGACSVFAFGQGRGTSTTYKVTLYAGDKVAGQWITDHVSMDNGYLIFTPANSRTYVACNGTWLVEQSR